MNAVADLHVLPHEPEGTWTVEDESIGLPLSSHDTADQAEVAARRVAAARGVDHLYLHDRYQRVRTLLLGTPRR